MGGRGHCRGKGLQEEKTDNWFYHQKENADRERGMEDRVERLTLVDGGVLRKRGRKRKRKKEDEDVTLKVRGV